MSTFGHYFRVTTFGESHCKGVGAIVDGWVCGVFSLAETTRVSSLVILLCHQRAASTGSH